MKTFFKTNIHCLLMPRRLWKAETYYFPVHSSHGHFEHDGPSQAVNEMLVESTGPSPSLAAKALTNVYQTCRENCQNANMTCKRGKFKLSTQVHLVMRAKLAPARRFQRIKHNVWKVRFLKVTRREPFSMLTSIVSKVIGGNCVRGE